MKLLGFCATVLCLAKKKFHDSFVDQIIHYLAKKSFMTHLWTKSFIIWREKKIHDSFVDQTDISFEQVQRAANHQKQNICPVQKHGRKLLQASSAGCIFLCNRTGQTTGNIWAPKYYIFPINALPHRPPLKKIRKIPENFQAKAIQGHVPWVNLKKNFQISFSQ